MGTGSVTVRFCCCSRFSDRACPHFRTVNVECRGKGGQAPSGRYFHRNSGPFVLGASPPFPFPLNSLTDVTDVAQASSLCSLKTD